MLFGFLQGARRWCLVALGLSPAPFSLSSFGGLTGPAFHYSDTWQLIINTGTTIVTFLMVFLIQNTQNRDAKAVHLKLDEVIRALKGARNELIDLEKLADEDLTSLEKQFERVRKKAERNGNNFGPMSRANHAERASKDKGV
jgi:low affinity Fe/Cu permease